MASGEDVCGSLSLLRSKGGGAPFGDVYALAGLGGYENGPLGVPDSERSGDRGRSRCGEDIPVGS